MVLTYLKQVCYSTKTAMMVVMAQVWGVGMDLVSDMLGIEGLRIARI